MPSLRGVLVVAVAACGGSPPTPSPIPVEPPARIEAPPPAPTATVVVPLHRPTPEVRPAATVTLPPIPAFAVPEMAAGIHSVRELRVAGRDLLGTKVRVAGYVTWIYDCIADLRRPGQSRAQVQRRIDEDPTVCERLKLYLGDTRDTPPDRALWVVDVPRPYNKLELARIAKVDRTPENYPDRCEPDSKRRGPSCFALAVGDYVVLDGAFAIVSPHSESNSDGLLVWASVQRATPPATISLRAVTPPAPVLPQLALAPVTAPPPAPDVQRASARLTFEGSRAYVRKELSTAEAKLTAATAAWPGNYSAWYALCGVRMAHADWRGAADASRRAFELVPDEPTYAMWYGVMLYKQAYDDACGAEARRRSMRPEDIDPDVSHVDFTAAEAVLRHAVSLEPGLWRAHYYLGRIARDGGRAKEAAEAFSAALAYAPTDPAPWIALGELYRKWDQPELTVAVAREALKYVAGRDLRDIWLVIGMALDDLHRDAPAIDAYGQALAIDPVCGRALFQRGEVYYRTGAFAEAKRDLEAFIKVPSSSMGFAAQQAHRHLVELARKRRRR
jgi:tetratricopeptide (TPR) repeat protein